MYINIFLVIVIITLLLIFKDKYLKFLQPKFLSPINNNISLINNSVFGTIYNKISSKYLNKTRVLVPVPLNLMKIIISFAEKTPFSPLTSEQLLLFEKDNILQNIDKSFKNLDINPQDTLQITKNIIEN